MNLPQPLLRLCNLLHEHGAHPILVGGYVRDFFLGHDSKDIDIEVYGLHDIEPLKTVLSSLAKVHEVGKSFGVLKLSFEGYDFDVALPRTERKIAQGHRGFHIQTNAQLDFKTAAKRRDFTMNAIGYDVQTKSFLDPYNGKDDIQNQTIRHVHDNSFTEDPLRVLRAVQFASRFNFTLDHNTLKLCQNMVQNKMLDELPKERIFEEYKKLLLKSPKPSFGFKLIDELGILAKELKALQGVPQNPQYHPEGDVWVHTMMSLDAMVSLKTGDEKKDMILMLAILCHDLGKPEVTQEIDGVIRSTGHENILEPSINFLTQLSDEKELLEQIKPLIKEHLMPSQLYQQNSGNSAVRRLSTRVNIENLVRLATADHFGRTTNEAKQRVYPAGEWLLRKARQLKVHTNKPQAILQGRHLIQLGLQPGVQFKSILDMAFEAQLDGAFENEQEALVWLKSEV
jgi:tRNA nucleotidyltransferase (CCA-adding enzyme)